MKGKEWPQDFKDLAGAWKDLPAVENIRQETTGVGDFFGIWEDKKKDVAAYVRDIWKGHQL